MVGSLSAQEWRLQAASRVSLDSLLNTETPGQSSLGGALRFTPEIVAETESFSFAGRVSATSRLEEPVPNARLEKLDLTLYPASWAVVRLGRFRHLPGTASIISPVNFFLTTDYESLLTGSGEEALQTRDLLQATAFLGRYFVTATVAPRPAAYPLPDPSSPWFPGADIPQSLSLRFPPGETVELDQVYLEQADFAHTISDISASFEVGGSFRWIDVSLFYFHGQNNTPVLQTELDFPQGLFEVYDIYVHPQVTSVDALGLAATAVVDRFRFILDASHAFNEVFNTDRLSVDNFRTELAETPWLEGTLGASYRIASPEVLLSVEYHRGFAFDQVERIVTPVLSSALAADARIRFLNRTLGVNLTALVSFVDYSWALVPVVSYAPVAAVELSLRAPQFFGPSGSELGQFRDNYLIAAALTWRF